MLPKITIVTPSFNQGCFIEDTIKSVINQNYPNLEYIIIDGGSTDNTIDIIKRYENWITFWKSEPDEGQSDAINKGITYSSGTIVTWLNSDDCFCEGALHKIAEYFMRNPEIKFIAGNSILINEKNERIGFLNAKCDNDKPFFDAFNSCIVQPASFFSKEIYDKFGPFETDMHFAMDVFFWIKLRANNIQLYIVNEYFALFRRYKNTKSATGGTAAFLNDLIKKIETYKKNDLSENVKKKLLNDFYKVLMINYYKQDKSILKRGFKHNTRLFLISVFYIVTNRLKSLLKQYMR